MKLCLCRQRVAGCFQRKVADEVSIQAIVHALALGERSPFHDPRVFVQWITDGQRTFQASAICQVLLNARRYQCTLGITCHHVTRFAASTSLIVLHHLRSSTHASAKAIDKSKSYRMKQLSNGILLNNAYCTLDDFNEFEVLPLFCQRRQIHASWVRLIIKSKHIHAIHGPRMALLYLVKQRSKVWTFITVRKLRMLRVPLRTEILAVFIILI